MNIRYINHINMARMNINYASETIPYLYQVINECNRWYSGDALILNTHRQVFHHVLPFFTMLFRVDAVLHDCVYSMGLDEHQEFYAHPTVKQYLALADEFALFCRTALPNYPSFIDLLIFYVQQPKNVV